MKFLNYYRNQLKVVSTLACLLPLVGQQLNVVNITRHIGHTLDAEENLHYKVFKDIPNFESAQFYEIDRNRFEARISYVDYTTRKLSRRAFSFKEITALQSRLNQMPQITDDIRKSFRSNLTYLRTKEVLKNIPTGQYISIKHLNGKWIKGTLISFDKDVINVQTPVNIMNVPMAKMEQINFREKIVYRHDWKLAIYGLAAMMGFTIMETWNRHTTPEWGPRWHNRFMGSIFGLLAGAETYDTSMILLTKKTRFGLTPSELESLNR